MKVSKGIRYEIAVRTYVTRLINRFDRPHSWGFRSRVPEGMRVVTAIRDARHTAAVQRNAAIAGHGSTTVKNP